VLSGLSDAHPVWCTVNDIIGEAAEGATVAAVQAEMAAEERSYQCGYLAALRDLRDELHRLRTEGQQDSS
jgi:hypothetical protein